MAISVLDVRDTFAAPRVRVPALRLVATGVDAVRPPAAADRRSPPAWSAILEAVGLLAVALTGLDGVLRLGAPRRLAARRSA